MRGTDTFEDLKSKYGDEIIKFTPSVDFTQDIGMDVPLELAVFNLPVDHLGGCIVAARYNEEVDEWHLNSGERFIITELLTRLNLK